MKTREDIRPISYFKANAAEVLDQVNATHRPFYVTQNGEARAVVLAPDSYEEMKDAINMLKIVAMSEQSIRSGKTHTHAEVAARLKKKFPG